MRHEIVQEIYKEALDKKVEQGKSERQNINKKEQLIYLYMTSLINIELYSFF